MKTKNDIIRIVQDQVSGYRALLDVLQRERECLVRLNAADVEALSKEKDTVVLRLRLLEEERLRLMNVFSAEASSPGDISLQQLSEITNDRTFLTLRQQLLSLLQAVSELNGFNRVLVERSSNTVRNALKFLGAVGVNPNSNAGGALLSREA